MTDEEKHAIWMKAQDILEQTAGVKDALRARQAAAGRGEGERVAPRPPEPPSAPGPRERPIDNWRGRVQGIVTENLTQMTKAIGMTVAKLREETVELADEAGAEVGKLGKQIAEMEGRITASETAVTELLMGLEGRIARLEERLEAEQRAASSTKPRLIGGSDAA